MVKLESKCVDWGRSEKPMFAQEGECWSKVVKICVPTMEMATVIAAEIVEDVLGERLE